MVQDVVYSAVMVNKDGQVAAHVDIPVNPRFLIVVPAPEGIDPFVAGGDEMPDLDTAPVGTTVFSRVVAVHTSETQRSSLFQFVAEKL